jgi:hypothetical protein
MYSIPHVIHERSTSIPIKKTPTTAMKEDHNEYGLKNNFFDPSKSSPPNEFMLKLQNRMILLLPGFSERMTIATVNDTHMCDCWSCQNA